MSDRKFPIQAERGAPPHPREIPWAIAELAFGVYSARYGGSQSLEDLAGRGGFGPSEMDKYLPDWRARCDAIFKLTLENIKLREENAILREENSNRGDQNTIVVKLDDISPRGLRDIIVALRAAQGVLSSSASIMRSSFPGASEILRLEARRMDNKAIFVLGCIKESPDAKA